MSAEEYFNLRQSTRAYQNPYEAGGIGVGGLTASARYNRQQVGSSFLSAPSGTNTWAARGGSGGVGGGYVSMPSTGPTPVTRDIERGQALGPSKPEATMSGTAGNFGTQRIDPFDPQWSSTRTAGDLLRQRMEKVAAGAAVVGLYGKRKERKRKEKELRKAMAGDAWDNAQPWRQLDAALDEGTVRKLSPAEASRYATIGRRVVPVPGKYDPSLGGSGVDPKTMTDVYGAWFESPSSLFTPEEVAENARRIREDEQAASSMRAETQRIRRRNLGIPEEQPMELGAGPVRGSYVTEERDEGPARIVRGIPTRNPQDRPTEEELTARLGRSATRGKRQAKKDPVEGSLFEPDN